MKQVLQVIKVQMQAKFALSKQPKTLYKPPISVYNQAWLSCFLVVRPDKTFSPFNMYLILLLCAQDVGMSAY